MSRRNKRASMREGPLADLFRSTAHPDEETTELPAGGDPLAPGERERASSEEETRIMRPGGEAGDTAAEAETRIVRPEEREREPSDRAREDREPFDQPEPEAAPRDVQVHRVSEPEPPASTRRGTSPWSEPIPEPAPPPEAPAEPRDRSERLRALLNERPRGDEAEGPRYGREEATGRPARSPQAHAPSIRVVGVGGGGVNAVNRMVEAQIRGIEFIAVNTDLQSLQQTTADVTVHIGAALTRGLGSGSDPKLGFQAAFDEQDRIKRLLKGGDLIFVTAGAGGGTGTGAAPVLARLAREVGALTVGIVTTPFSFEGNKRQAQAEQGIEALADEVDTLIVIPNERLLNVLARNTTMVEAFRVADDVLRQGVQGIAELVTLPGLINLDFADVRTTMRDAGRALLGIGMGTGDNRAIYAAERAISSPLLETSVDGARSILLSITGGPDLSLVEISEAARVIQESAHPDANIIFGANIDENLTEQVWVTVIATRFDARGRHFDGSSQGLRRDVVRPSARKTREREAGGLPRSPEARPRDLRIDVPEFIPSN